MTQVSTIQRAALAGDEAQYHTFINGALVAIATDFAGASAPTETYAHMNWTDTSTDPATARRRNAANSGWDALTIVFATQAEAEAGTDTAKAMNALRVKQSILANVDVGSLTAGLSFGDVGTYGFFVNDTIDRDFVAGSTYAGSYLRPAGVSQNAGSTSVSGGNMGGQPYQRGSSPSGTWRAMGSMDGSGAYNSRYTVFMRIA